MSEDNYSLSARVYRSIRSDILSGRYKNGDELKEKSIGDELGVSRTPVREALRQLDLEGLVNIVPNKGAYVEAVTAQDIRDIYEIRALLEGLCARWAAQNISDELMAEMEENIYLTEFHEKKNNSKQVLMLDNRFHEIMYEASGSKELKRILKDYHEYVGRVRSVTLGNSTRAKNSTMEHKQICQAIKEHDADKAEKYANSHIKSTKANMERLGWDNLLRKNSEGEKNGQD